MLFVPFVPNRDINMQQTLAENSWHSLGLAEPWGGRRARVLYADLPPSPPPHPRNWHQSAGPSAPLQNRKQILPDVAKGKRLCFHPMCLFSIYSEISGEINTGQKWVFFQSARNKYLTSEQSFSKMATTLVDGTLYSQTEGPWFNS